MCIRDSREADRTLYEALKTGDYDTWRDRPLAELEASGQHEMLNWYVLVGAMEALGRPPVLAPATAARPARTRVASGGAPAGRPRRRPRAAAVLLRDLWGGGAARRRQLPLLRLDLYLGQMPALSPRGPIQHVCGRLPILWAHAARLHRTAARATDS